MAPRPRRSKKRSAASSTAAKPLDRAVFYLDEAIYSKVLVEAIRASHATVRHAGDAFPFGTPDAIWLSEAGKRKWVVLTRDQRIRHRRLEIESLVAAGVAAFAFTAGQATALETAQAIVPLIAKMANMAVSEPKPFLYTFGISRHLSRVRLPRHVN
jgi:hypothetical protein